MDYLVLRKCSGNSFCHYGHRIQTGLLRLLQAQGLLPSSIAIIRPLHLPAHRPLLAHSPVHAQRPLRLLASRSLLSHLRRPFSLGTTLMTTRSLCTRPSASLETETEAVESWLRPHLDGLGDEVSQALASRLDHPHLHTLTTHYFSKGSLPHLAKTYLVTLAWLSIPGLKEPGVSSGQKTVALISEMIHTASLVHDDLIDDSPTRRGLPSVHTQFGNKAAVLTGDYILASATKLLCSLGNPEVIRVLAQVIEDLVKGEFMQLGDREGFDKRFAHYMEKTYKKTASLFANSCDAVALLSASGSGSRCLAWEMGKQLGLAFQLMDDVLDCEASESELGKPTGADVRLGLATAPFLFAARRNPALEPLIRRRFSEPGDAETALSLLAASGGLEEARRLAESHAQEAARLAGSLKPSPFSRALVEMARAQTRRRG